ncbi:phospholipase D-like domain-containing protein [Kordiimonas aquimaris]|uniref:phospholipase D-like domain-containing protein n=1 Tax=Kordiimonas aquimaris TaxID=707591 RepID=UPI0021D123D2|nr:phospholipase D-like domain-containing protein [Kordiimonas aquimaris]
MDFEAMVWPDGVAIAFSVLAIQILVSIHILNTKDEVRSAIAWCAVVWLAPVFGLIFYGLFGISRIKRRAVAAREKRGLAPRITPSGAMSGPTITDINANAANRWVSHDLLARRVTASELTAGNSVEPLNGGREAYDAMICAIDGAEKTVALSTYIFQADQAGRRFVAALFRAKERGVDVKVLVDAVGNLYGLKPVTNLLRRHGIDVATFNPARVSWRLAFFNLRTHRKMLMIDGSIAFTGGMNIRKHHLEDKHGNQRVRDTHFKLAGPIVQQMIETFADDWLFSNQPMLDDEVWADTNVKAGGKIAARAISDGPDEPFQKTAMLMESALSSARERVQIISPYFLPEQELVAELKQAALRGVKIDILIPEKNNLPFFSVAAMSGMRQLVSAGCNLYLSPPPFDHTKLMIVDGVWTLFGSSNWDARSLKLNFEFNVECYDPDLGQQMCNWVKPRFDKARQVTVNDLKNRPRSHRIFGRIMWLASPYL